MADVKDLKVFGVHGPSSAAARSSYVDYVKRDKDSALEAALAEATSGGRRVVLIVGDSAAGKSRTASEAVRRDRALRCWRLVVPLSDGGLSQLAKADLGWQDTILWLDDLDKYLARGLDLGTLRRVLGDDPTVVVVATMRTSQLQARQSELADPAWEFLTDDSEVTQVDLEASLSDDELHAASAKISDTSTAERAAGRRGPRRMARRRAGADEEAQRRPTSQPGPGRHRHRLVPHRPRPAPGQGGCPTAVGKCSSLDAASKAAHREPGEQNELFEQASDWACEPVISRDLYEQALITQVGRRVCRSRLRRGPDCARSPAARGSRPSLGTRPSGCDDQSGV